MDFSGVLLALDLGELIRIVVIILIIGFSVVGKLLTNSQQANKRPPQRNPVPRPRPQPDPRSAQARPAQLQPAQPQPAQPGAGQRTIEHEIEEFLRQARGGKPAAVADTPPAPPPTPPQSVVDAVSVSEPFKPGRGFGTGVSSYVQEHLGPQHVGEREEHLAERIEATDERVEHHLEDVFEHDVGHLDHAEKIDMAVAEGTDAAVGEKDQPLEVTVAGIVDMLRSPVDIRKAFVLAEILKRPEI